MNIVLPAKQHLQWADCEIGVLIHYDIQVFAPNWKYGDMDHMPSPACFNPVQLNTDQWVETAKKLGAKYAILVAKHSTGFSLWPTKAHDYSVASSPWKNGKGDIVADFITSCKKYGLLPGLYYSCPANYKWKVNNGAPVEDKSPEYLEKYIEMMLTQMRELWSNYGPLFEIWFDGGLLAAAGDRIAKLALELQPNAVAFQGDPDRMICVRWIGNERAVAPVPCFTRTNGKSSSDGMKERAHSPEFFGDFNGRYWCPGEADMPCRDQIHAYLNGWFWQKGEDGLVYPPEELLDRYYVSVGRGCNLLLGMVVDNRGLIPDADVAQLEETGKLIKAQFRNLIGKTSGKNQFVFNIDVPDKRPVDLICVKEDISLGENVKFYVISGFDGKDYHTLVTGTSLGHKALHRIRPFRYQSYQLKIYSHEIRPNTDFAISEFSLWKR